MNISFLGRKTKTKEQLIDEICAKLTKQGYKWQMMEGDLMVVKNNSNFRVIFLENSNKTLFHTYFIWYYSDEYFKRFKEWWLDVATCMTNRKNRLIILNR